MAIFRKRINKNQFLADLIMKRKAGHQASGIHLSDYEKELLSALLEYMRNKFLGTRISGYQLVLIDSWRNEGMDNEATFQFLNDEDHVFGILKDYKDRNGLPAFLEEIYNAIIRKRRNAAKSATNTTNILRYAWTKESLFSVYPLLKYITFAITFGAAFIGLTFLVNPAHENKVSYFSGNHNNKFYKLPDGSKVWLNSNTTLTFPKNFDRVVLIEGEAYFDIQKAKTPFKVQTNSELIEVLGTTFNLKAYNGGAEVTTLLTGGLRVTSLNDVKNQKILTPGQQCVFSGDSLEVSPYLIDPTNWLNDRFSFHGLFDAMEDLSRWYGYSIKYVGNVKNVQFSASPPRSTPIVQLLSVLSNYGINAQLKGKTILVYSK